MQMTRGCWRFALDTWRDAKQSRGAQHLGRLAVALLILASLGCAEDLFHGNPQIDGLRIPVPYPANNPPNAKRIELGRLLFWDPILSGPRDVACATCHHPAHDYADGRARSIGTGGIGLGPNRFFPIADLAPTRRNAPTVLNVAYNGLLEESRMDTDPTTAPTLWDARVKSLELQALEPLRSRDEMRGDAYTEAAALDSVVARLRQIDEYVRLFGEAFAEPQPVTKENLGKAIAAFERTLIATDTRFDRYSNGDRSALTTFEKRGLSVFLQAGCYRCHSGPMFSDFQVHVLGVAPTGGAQPDEGAGAFAFRTPTLRNVANTAPYMHNGSQRTLREVVEFYADARSAHPAVPSEQLDEDFEPILPIEDDMVDALVAFLEALSDGNFDREIPPRAPSGLQVGGSITPAP